PGQRANEGAGTSRRGISLGHQRRDGSQRARFIAADRGAEGEAAASLFAIRAAERRAIVGLGLALAAEEVVSETAIAAEYREGRAKLLGTSKISERGLCFAMRNRDRAHSRLGHWAPRIDLVRAGEESGGCLVVAKLQRSFAGADQGAEILGVGSQRPDVSRERGCR